MTGGYLVTMITYWTVGPVYLLVDVLKWPEWFYRCKLQPGTNDPVELKRLGQVTMQINKYFVNHYQVA